MPYLPEIPPWLAKWFEDQSNPYPRDGRYNYYDPYAGQQVGPLEVPFSSAAAYGAQKNGVGAEIPSHTVGRQVGANEYPSGAMLKFPSWMGGPPIQVSGKNYAQFLMSYINQGNTDGPPNPFSELKANPLMAQLLAAKAGRGPNPYLPSTQNYIPDKGPMPSQKLRPMPPSPKPIHPRPIQPPPKPNPILPPPKQNPIQPNPLPKFPQPMQPERPMQPPISIPVAPKNTFLRGSKASTNPPFSMADNNVPSRVKEFNAGPKKPTLDSFIPRYLRNSRKV